MWTNFFVAFFAAIVILVVPGFGLMALLGFDWLNCLCFSPAISVALLSVVCIVYGELGVFSSCATVLVPLSVLSIALLLVTVVRQRKAIDARSLRSCSLDVRCLSAFVTFALLIVGWYFVRTLDGPASFSQEHDNIHHLLEIREFLVTGQMSSLHENVYSIATSKGLPTPSAAGAIFYPSGWHVVAALVAELIGGNAALAQNAVIFVFLVLVWPLSSFVLLSQLFNDRKDVLYAGSVVSLAFSAFPWQFLIFGTLYPNFGGYCLVPIAVVAFMRMCEGTSGKEALRYLLVFCVSSFGMAIMHPNTIFTAAVILFPYCLHQIPIICSAYHGPHKLSPRVAQLLFIVLFTGCWLALYSSSVFQSVVHFDWAPFASVRGQLLNVLTLSFKSGQAQEILGALVLIGLFACMAGDSLRWLALSYAIAFVICFVNGATSIGARSLLSGFWYNDQFRVGGMMALVCLPLACEGVGMVKDFLKRAYDALGYSRDFSPWMRRKTIVVYGLLAAILFVPSFQVAGRTWHHTAFGKIEDALLHVNSMTSIMSPEENDFMKEASNIVGKDDLVLNQPHDGSVFGSIEYGLNLYYLTTSTPSPSSESFESRMVRTGLNLYGSSYLVHDAVEKLGADYLLILDVDGTRSGNRYWYGHYHEKDWVGINAVNDDTPGFEVVLSRGDMRLYRIVR